MRERSAAIIDSPDVSVLSHRASARALRRLREWISDGVIPDGQPLPSERVLAERLQVNPKTVRNAVGVLTEEGIIRISGKRIRMVHAGVRKVQASSGLMNNTIAVLTADANLRTNKDKQTGLSSHITYGILDEITALGKHSLALNPSTLDWREFEQLIDHRPLGVVALFKRENWAKMKSSVDRIRDAGVPVVVYGDGPELEAYDRVVSDHEAGGYELTRWLISQGRRRILCLWQQADGGYWLDRRHVGYLRALEEAGLEPLPLLERAIPVDRVATKEQPDTEDFSTITRLFAGHMLEYLTGPDAVDAILLASDGDVAPVCAACRLFGKTPGKDVSVAGYDSYWMDALFTPFEPAAPSATVDKLNPRMGAAMTRLLVDRVAGHLSAEPHRRVVAPELIVPEQIGAEFAKD